MLDSVQNCINIEELANCLYSDLAFDSNGYIRYKGSVVAVLVAGEDFYLPSLLLEKSAFIEITDEKLALANLKNFLFKELNEQLQPIFKLKNADKLSEKAQFLVDLLLKNYGVVKRSEVANQLQNLDQFERATIRQLGVRFGRFHVYLSHILKPGCAKILMMLFFLQHHDKDKAKSEAILSQMLRGKTTIMRDEAIEDIYYNLAGYDIWNNYAIRVDITERLANYVQQALNWKNGIEPKPEGAYNGCYFFITPYVLSVLGLSYEAGSDVFKALGYVSNRVEYNSELASNVVQIKPANEAENNIVKMDLWTFVNKIVQKKKKIFSENTKNKLKFKKTKPTKINYDSPFSVLLKLKKEL